MNAIRNARRLGWTLGASTCLGTVLAGSPAFAQDTAMAQAGGQREIIVTARKREETVMRTPVVLQVKTAEEIQNLNIQDIVDIANASPGVTAIDAFGSVGTVLFMRGIGSGSSAIFIDQSVGLNVDGMGVSHGAFYSAGSFDMQQIEVLKGPQGLFFGKSTTAGIVAIHTADPTPTLESGVTAGYEFTADETKLEGYVSGPLSENLGIRVAGYYDHLEGWLRNPNPDYPLDPRLPEESRYGGRVTLKYDSGDLRAKLKVGFLKIRGNASTGMMNQAYGCPLGMRQNTYFSYDNCKVDKYTQGALISPPYNPDIDWLGGEYDPAFSPITIAENGQPYSRTRTRNAVFELNYDLQPGLTFTSLTGYAWVRNREQITGAFYGGAPGFYPAFQLASTYRQRDITQELRLTSDWNDSWINFTLGGLYAPSKNKLDLWSNVPDFFIWTEGLVESETEVWSGFGQVLLTPVENWELAAGLRYTDVTRKITRAVSTGNIGNVGVDQTDDLAPGDRRISEDNASPEVTLTYRPTEDLTLFGSYKWGYKGPGLNVGTFLAPDFTAGQITTFGGEKVKGFEAGVKAQLLDRHMNVSASVYRYRYDGLQVSFFDPVTQGVTINNGADARITGAELEVNARVPGSEWLSFNAFVAYNDAKYLSFPRSPCFGGQTEAQGCALDPVTMVPVQDLGGRRPYHSPKWVGTFGATASPDISSDWFLTMNASAQFSSKYQTLAALAPTGYQDSWITVDGSIRVGPKDGPWEIGLLGRNLFNKLYITAGDGAGSAMDGVSEDAFGYVNRARQVMLQVTIRPDRL